MENTNIPFATFLETAFDSGMYATDDIIAFVLPLFEEVLSFHENNQVAPFENEVHLFVNGAQLDIDERYAHAPTFAVAVIKKLTAKLGSAQFDIIGNKKLSTNVDEGLSDYEDLEINFNDEKVFTAPAFTKGYIGYEIKLGHHDAQTDIFCLGLILGSMALGLNLYEEDDVKAFVQYRRTPVQLNDRIHPTIAALITEMTALDRAKRNADLYDIIFRLKSYRDYNPDKQIDLSKTAGWVNKEISSRHQYILNKLKNRLFDTSRRNRLLYYKPNARFVNLTVSSVPLVLHYQSIRPELLFTWNAEISGKVKGLKEIVLNKYLRFEDHQYLTAALNKIRVESQKDLQEFGFSQLKLVPAFLNWHNLKETAHERIQSPLLLIPVELKRNKKLKEDHFTIKVLDNNAEVNPVLANQLKELYGIRLPDFVALDETEMFQFYQSLKVQIDEANQGIQLQYSSKPKVKLVHSVAKQTLNNYRRRLKTGGGHLESYKNLSYSYQKDNYKPLGLEIFKTRIEHRSSFLEFLINDDIKPGFQQLTGSNEKSRELFEMAESEENPYNWEFDVCNVVLGNFNYKKMSLVRDYNQVIDNHVEHSVFETLFSEKPKQYNSIHIDLNKVEDWHHIITADPTQTQAILQSRIGESYIIQGPPGTGKSQTITNLIADFAARGKSVLFICEKRAALDVVYHRLKQNGLDELCCYIHDSQSDKREFIKDLKATYEDFVKNKMDVKKITEERNSILSNLRQHIKLLEEFHRINAHSTPDTGVSIRALMERIIEIKHNGFSLHAAEEEMLPPYAEWLQSTDAIGKFVHLLEEITGEETFASHAFSNINDYILQQENPVTLIESISSHTKNVLSEIETIIRQNNTDLHQFEKLEELKLLIQDAVILEPLAQSGNISLIDTGKAAAKNFDKELRRYQQLQKNSDAAQKKNVNWQNKFSREDADAAIQIAEKHEKSFFKFLNGSWRKLKKQIQQSYNLSNHQVKPSYSTILKLLQVEYQKLDELGTHRQQVEDDYKLNNLDVTALVVEKMRTKRGDKEIEFLLAQADADAITLNLCRLNNLFHQLELQLRQTFIQYENKSIPETRDALDSIGFNIDALRDLMPALKNFSQLPARIKTTLRKIPLTAAQAEATIAQKTLKTFLQQHASFASIDFEKVDHAVAEIKKNYQRLLKLNALHIRATIRQKFSHHVEISNTVLSQLDNEQKNFKKAYTEGRKIVENEFGKTIRFKSIRELSAKESGLVLKDLKPVWMMSPLSVSDSLPLEKQFFDVVIFDEASQITLEEGIPALYRSPQTIIVGDDKQMPPTNFFTSKAEDPDDIETAHVDDDILLSEEADSLLTQGARKLNSSMLSWHYRSRYETLISYSNHAFYKAGLLTIPDRTIHHSKKQAIEVSSAEQAKNYVDCLYDRSISFHFMTNSLYEKRSNRDEANYIAHLVRALLQRNVKETIGIVAFSQEQQTTIGDALTELAEKDKDFELLLEEAYNRTEDEQFTGLIVKNLENIQGDERDIIIMSVCYGFDARKKMIMNFGPINKKGGEKRLNVIFSRAKRHMAVISSIKHHNITNEYNEGANYFKRFLQYAENVSAGNMQIARSVLDGLIIQEKEKHADNTTSIVAKQVKEELTKRGYEVMEQVGQSDFKCHLAIKKNNNDREFSLSILIDDDKHYNNKNLIEQYYQRPGILQAFGWKTLNIFVKDWLQQPGKMTALIIKKLNETLSNDAEQEAKQSKGDENYSITVQESNVTNPSYSLPTEEIVYDRLVFKDEKSDKFWETALQENKILIRFGKTGSRGQTQVKSFADADTAIREKEKMIAEKLKNGYARV